VLLSTKLLSIVLSTSAASLHFFIFDFGPIIFFGTLLLCTSSAFLDNFPSISDEDQQNEDLEESEMSTGDSLMQTCSVIYERNSAEHSETLKDRKSDLLP
jgi:hypothetical protein